MFCENLPQEGSSVGVVKVKEKRPSEKRLRKN